MAGRLHQAPNGASDYPCKGEVIDQLMLGVGFAINSWQKGAAAWGSGYNAWLASPSGSVWLWQGGGSAMAQGGPARGGVA